MEFCFAYVSASFVLISVFCVWTQRANLESLQSFLPDSAGQQEGSAAENESVHRKMMALMALDRQGKPSNRGGQRRNSGQQHRMGQSNLDLTALDWPVKSSHRRGCACGWWTVNQGGLWLAKYALL
eukprot:1145949-Pelagomonas_calceolata.AAC.3